MHEDLCFDSVHSDVRPDGGLAEVPAALVSGDGRGVSAGRGAAAGWAGVRHQLECADDDRWDYAHRPYVHRLPDAEFAGGPAAGEVQKRPLGHDFDVPVLRGHFRADRQRGDGADGGPGGAGDLPEAESEPGAHDSVQDKGTVLLSCHPFLLSFALSTHKIFLRPTACLLNEITPEP